MNPLNYLKTSALSFSFYTMASFGAVCTFAVTAHAEEPEMAKMEKVEMMKDEHMASDMMKKDAMMRKPLASGDFTRKNKTLKGSYEVIQENGQTIIRFADNFKASNGPDLKVFLSPQSIETAKGRNATSGSVLLGFVKSNKGAQDYVVPAGIDLANFGSVLIHCEKFSVLWGGGNI